MAIFESTEGFWRIYDDIITRIFDEEISLKELYVLKLPYKERIDFLFEYFNKYKPFCIGTTRDVGKIRRFAAYSFMICGIDLCYDDNLVKLKSKYLAYDKDKMIEKMDIDYYLGLIRNDFVNWFERYDKYNHSVAHDCADYICLWCLIILTKLELGGIR